MQRTLVKQGGSTLTIALPSPWIQKHGLKPGDKAEIIESGPNLIIGTKEISTPKKIELDLSSYNQRMVLWVLSVCHKSGYDEISITFDDQKVLTVINNVVKNLFTGFIISEHTKKRVILRNIVVSMEEELNTILNRAFHVTLTLGEEMITLLKQKNYEDLIHLLPLEDTNNQLTNQCERIVNSRGFHSKDTYLYVIIWNLEKVCDVYKYMCKYVHEAKNVILDAEVLAVLTQTNEFLREYFHLLNNFDIKRANEIFERRSSMPDEIRNLLTKSKGHNTIVLSYLLTAYEQIEHFFTSTIGLNV